ncbi:TAXI family TRAP transporter solute-binding subunit [Chondromyces crocatus]|uniref:C4-dicarboxylate ABC transporter substrate-binding protein n=1 Tax=Chondromyces crocatus TaxID=52 RepID=A0A0K1ENW2_CHOCO|nr:TAXI family TRAP transporter solute-binding subunit [Chondromyces crocatus]AKT42546.1 C4-dicarboxylate ABC transporter substrate-binding protein [Chondromyces crocatus]
MIKKRFRRETFESYRKELLRVWGLLLAIGVAALVGTYLLFVEPPPPRQLTIATGQRTGRYHAFAEAYRKILEYEGIHLDIRETAGSSENLKLLLDPDSGVSVAFVQGGAAPSEPPRGLSALASVYREPLWIFHRGDRSYDRLTDLVGKQLSIGPEGSGTRTLSLRLLEDNGITLASQAEAGVPMLGLPDQEAAKALLEGRLDAAFFVVGPGAEPVQTLIRSEGIHLLSFRQHESYLRLHRFLTTATVSEGLFDLARNIPPESSTLIAPAAALIANETLHPALIPLLVEAAVITHEGGNLLDAPGEFPSPRNLEIPVHPEGRRILTHGQSFLYRFLPFWLASMVDRLKFMLVPLLTVVFSLLKLAQPIYHWRIRSRIYRHYQVLRRAEQELSETAEPKQRAKTIAALEELEGKLGQLSAPLWSMADIYQLRLHLGHVRRQLEGEPSSQGEGAEKSERGPSSEPEGPSSEGEVGLDEGEARPVREAARSGEREALPRREEGRSGEREVLPEQSSIRPKSRTSRDP